ncbi:MAG: pirin family protein [Candidatus Moraniibacteriota bacterium]
MKTVFYEAGSRGYAKHGWLTTHHSFSFASYYDPERMGFGALRVLNDDQIAPGSGFGRHSHDNMEIITIPLSGSLRHQDSMGNSAIVTTGEVQVMSAGTGVEHAEYNASETEDLTLFQIWILTAKHDTVPRYDQRRFDPAEYHNMFRQVVGPMDTQDGLAIHQDARISLGRFEAGEECVYTPTTKDYGVYFLVIEGEATVAGKRLLKRDALGVWGTEKIPLKADGTVFLLSIEVPMKEMYTGGHNE